jgi:hypothetical protein
VSQHFGAFNPLPFNAPVDAQRIRGPHLINLADGKIHEGIALLNEVAETWKVPGYGYYVIARSEHTIPGESLSVNEQY